MSDEFKPLRKNLYTALAKAQSEYKAVGKSGVNKFFNNAKYPTLDDYLAASTAALTKNGLCVSQDLVTVEGKLKLFTTLAHSSGEEKTTSFDLILSKNDMQALGSAATYGRRYAYAAITGMAPEDDDGNLATGKGFENDKNQQGNGNGSQETGGSSGLANGEQSSGPQSQKEGYKRPKNADSPSWYPSEKQIKLIRVRLSEAGWTDANWQQYKAECLGIKESKELSYDQLQHVLKTLGELISFDEALKDKSFFRQK
jgi:hypothetical protein